MHKLPDIRVWQMANEYQEAASLCDQNHVGWPAAINAALAIEIYLKSFLSKEVRVQINDLGVSQSFKKTERGHDLFDLFKRIEPDLQFHLTEQYALIDSKNILPDLLKKHKDIFFNARYAYEKDAIKMVGNDVVHLAEAMKETVLNVAKIVHPPLN